MSAERFFREAVSGLMSGERPILWRSPEGELRESPDVVPRGILSGAFNPLHAGHRELRAAAADRLGGEVYYELPIHNADKRALDLEEVHQRWRQFDGAWLAVTPAATFVEKCRLFPGRVFVVGVDTAERILETRFYGDCVEQRDMALRELARQGCSFLVAARVVAGRLRLGVDLAFPAEFRELFAVLPESEFRRDLCSSDLRAAKRAEADQGPASESPLGEA